MPLSESRASDRLKFPRRNADIKIEWAVSETGNKTQMKSVIQGTWRYITGGAQEMSRYLGDAYHPEGVMMINQ
jgi:hypothetical protein